MRWTVVSGSRRIFFRVSDSVGLLKFLDALSAGPLCSFAFGRIMSATFPFDLRASSFALMPAFGRKGTGSLDLIRCTCHLCMLTLALRPRRVRSFADTRAAVHTLLSSVLFLPCSTCTHTHHTSILPLPPSVGGIARLACLIALRGSCMARPRPVREVIPLYP